MTFKKKNSPGWIDYKEMLSQDLQDSEEAIAYLQGALDDEDPNVYLLALQDVLEACKGKLPVEIRQELTCQLLEVTAEQRKIINKLFAHFEVKLYEFEKNAYSAQPRLSLSNGSRQQTGYALGFKSKKEPA